MGFFRELEYLWDWLVGPGKSCGLLRASWGAGGLFRGLCASGVDAGLGLKASQAAEWSGPWCLVGLLTASVPPLCVTGLFLGNAYVGTLLWVTCGLIRP